MSLTDDLPETPITGDIKRRKAPWWAAIITTIVMALGGASGAIFNYLDARDARRIAVKEAKTEGAINAVWAQKQVRLYETEIASLKADLRVMNAEIVGLNRRLELLEQRSGRSAVRAGRQVRIEVPDKDLVMEREKEALEAQRPEKPTRTDPAVQKMVQEALE